MQRLTTGKAFFFALLCSIPATGHSQHLPGIPVAPFVPSPLSEARDPADYTRLRPTADLSESTYLENISELERQRGPQTPELADQLIGLGFVYRDRGDHTGAAEVFERALQIKRIDQGLHHVDHLPLVELIIETHQARSDWAATDRYYRLLYWVVTRERGRLGPAVVAPLIRIAGWNLRAHREDTGRSIETHLGIAERAIGDAIATIERYYGQSDPRLSPVLALTAIADFYMSLFMQELNATQIVSTKADVREIVRRQHIIMDRYRHGELTLHRLVAIQDGDPGRKADAIVLLADWYLLFGRYHAARSRYAEAFNYLRSTGVPDAEINQRWAKPVSLPAPWRDTEIGATDESANEPDGPHVVARFDVTRDGVLRHVDTTAQGTAAARRLEAAVRRRLSLVHFRPRLLNGEPVPATGVEMRFPFTADVSPR